MCSGLQLLIKTEKLDKGEDYNVVEEPGRQKREEQQTVSVGLTTRSKWFPFRVFTEIFILDFVQSSAAAAMARPRRRTKQPFFPPTSFFVLVLVSLWLPCTAHSPPPPPQHSYPSFGCVAAAAALPLRW
jgi:hypothetical protein